MAQDKFPLNSNRTDDGGNKLPDNVENIKSIKNPRLIEGINALKEEATPETQSDFINALLNAKLIVPVTMKPKAEDKTKLDVTFSKITNTEGKHFFVSFTDIETLMKSSAPEKSVQVIPVSYMDFSRMLSDPKCPYMGFAINPFTENMVVSKEQIEYINKVLHENGVKDGSRVLVAELKETPAELAELLESYFKKTGNVEKAYILKMKQANEDKLLIIVDYRGDDQEKYLTTLAPNLKPFETESRKILIVGFDSDFSREAVKEKIPFFVNV